MAKDKILNGNFDKIINDKKTELNKVEEHKMMLDYIDLMFLKNTMMVNVAAGDLEMTREMLDVPIMKDISDIKRVLYGDNFDPEEKTGVLNKVNKMFRDWVFSKRMIAALWAAFGGSIIGVIIALVILSIKLMGKGL